MPTVLKLLGEKTVTGRNPGKIFKISIKILIVRIQDNSNKNYLKSHFLIFLINLLDKKTGHRNNTLFLSSVFLYLSQKANNGYILWNMKGIVKRRNYE